MPTDLNSWSQPLVALGLTFALAALAFHFFSTGIKNRFGQMLGFVVGVILMVAGYPVIYNIVVILDRIRRQLGS